MHGLQAGSIRTFTISTGCVDNGDHLLTTNAPHRVPTHVLNAQAPQQAPQQVPKWWMETPRAHGEEFWAMPIRVWLRKICWLCWAEVTGFGFALATYTSDTDFEIRGQLQGQGAHFRGNFRANYSKALDHPAEWDESSDFKIKIWIQSQVTSPLHLQALLRDWIGLQSLITSSLASTIQVDAITCNAMNMGWLRLLLSQGNCAIKMKKWPLGSMKWTPGQANILLVCSRLGFKYYPFMGTFLA